MLVLKAAAVWLIILVCAILNGALREAVLLPSLGAPGALILSGVLLSAFVLIVSIVFIQWLEPRNAAQALSIGLVWLCLTLVFEFGFGRLVQRRAWSELLDAYTFQDGNIWPLVLAVIFFAPLLAVRLRS